MLLFEGSGWSTRFLAFRVPSLNELSLGIGGGFGRLSNFLTLSGVSWVLPERVLVYMVWPGDISLLDE